MNMKTHSPMNSEQLARVEQALIALSDARDGNGLGVRLDPREVSQQALRERLYALVGPVMPRGTGNAVFLGRHGEEAWLRNLMLLANALLVLCEAEGGSELNHEIPGFRDKLS
jgi:hypothetical protein